MDYYRATSVADAVKTLEKNKGAKLLAGGHSLIPAMKLRVANPLMLVDIGHIKNLNGIKVTKKEVRIGALTTHAAVAVSAELNDACPDPGRSRRADRRSAGTQPRHDRGQPGERRSCL
jgi:carbon-monoxide dehydrogenase medium subunit